jgi:hypothetical protein
MGVSAGDLQQLANGGGFSSGGVGSAQPGNKMGGYSGGGYSPQTGSYGTQSQPSRYYDQGGGYQGGGYQPQQYGDYQPSYPSRAPSVQEGYQTGGYKGSIPYPPSPEAKPSELTGGDGPKPAQPNTADTPTANPSDWRGRFGSASGSYGYGGYSPYRGGYGGGYGRYGSGGYGRYGGQQPQGIVREDRSGGYRMPPLKQPTAQPTVETKDETQPVAPKPTEVLY